MPKSGTLRLREPRANFPLINDCRELGVAEVAWQSHLLAQIRQQTVARICFSSESPPDRYGRTLAAGQKSHRCRHHNFGMALASASATPPPDLTPRLQRRRSAP